MVTVSCTKTLVIVPYSKTLVTVSCTKTLVTIPYSKTLVTVYIIYSSPAASCLLTLSTSLSMPRFFLCIGGRKCLTLQQKEHTTMSTGLRMCAPRQEVREDRRGVEANEADTTSLT